MSLQAEYQNRLNGPWSDIQGHLTFMYETCLAYQHVRILELGTRTGESTSAFLAAAEAVAGSVWSVDIDPPQVPALFEQSGLWSFTQADDMGDLPADLMAGGFDVLFLDTSHEYDHTIAEFGRFVPLVRPGGVVLCHDTQWVFPATDLGVPDGPVAKALDTYCAASGLTWTNRTGFYGMGVIDVPLGLEP